MSDHAEILRTGGALARRRQGRRAGDRGERPGAPRRGRPARSSRSTTTARLSARSRAAASKARSSRRRWRRSRTASRGSWISASATSRPGKSVLPAAARSRSSSSASNEEPISRCGDRRQHARPLGGARDRAEDAARSSSSTADRSEGDLALDDASWRRCARRCAPTATARSIRRRAASSSQVFNPPRRCFVVGAVHIAQPLARMLSARRLSADRRRPARALRHRGALPGASSFRPNGRTRRWSASSPTTARPSSP